MALFFNVSTSPLSYHSCPINFVKKIVLTLYKSFVPLQMKNVNLEIPPIEKLPRQLDFKLENKPQCHSGVRLERCQKTFEKFIKALLKMKISTKVGVLFVIFGCSSGLPQQNGSQLEARTDLIQGCTPQELLDLDNENVACYKRVNMSCCFLFQERKPSFSQILTIFCGRIIDKEKVEMLLGFLYLTFE